jgi:hypothetical protein
VNKIYEEATKGVTELVPSSNSHSLFFSQNTHTLFLSLSHTHPHTHTQTHTHTHTHCLFISLTHCSVSFKHTHSRLLSLSIYLFLSQTLTHTHFIYIGASHSSKVNYDKAIKEFFWKCSKPSEIGIQHFVSKPSKGGWQLYVLQSLILYLLWIKQTFVKLCLNSKAVQIN